MKNTKILLIFATSGIWLVLNGSAAATEIVVATDGSGHFKTVQAAVDTVPENNTTPIVIFIRPGIYKERIIVPRGKRFVRFVGQDANTTVLIFDLNANMKDDNGQKIGTFRTPSTTIEANDFSAENITFENSAGPIGQALAITVIGDRAVFRNCRFLGWQDTLLAQTGRQYYENCYIAGHCDFIFGGATAFFENCHIHCLKRGYITAAATPQHQPYGYVFSSCKITGESSDFKTYLGRPWRDYANVIFLNTWMSEVVRPEGWNNWGRPEREQTSRYGEFGSTGPGANPQARVRWAHQLTEAEAKIITLEEVLGGIDEWNPKTGQVRFPVTVVTASGKESATNTKIHGNDPEGRSVYLFASSRGDGLYLTYSFDGYTWTDLSGPFLKSNVGHHKLMQDPSIAQGPDGTFHLIWVTGSEDDKGFGYASSRDIIHWSEQKFIEPMSHEPMTAHVLAPELFYDDAAKQFIIIWASTILPNRYQSFQEPTNYNPRLWYTTTCDFETFTQAELFFNPGYSVRDGVIVKYNKRYALLHKNNSSAMQDLRVAFADNPLGPWGPSSDPFTNKFAGAPTVLKLGDEWIVYFDMHEEGRYGAVKTRDFRVWTNITNLVSFPAEHRHGTVFEAPRTLLELLRKQSYEHSF